MGAGPSASICAFWARVMITYASRYCGSPSHSASLATGRSITRWADGVGSLAIATYTKRSGLWNWFG